ncbi:MAG: SO_0444 family Cu/Zn efflux transporter [Acidobacteria bacterium]|nr:SO_0444 family Cu/Zn efflux transporter [Acidobacteriota bacterium]
MTIVFQVFAASWSLLGEMAPYLLFGFLVAGLLSVFVSPEWVEQHLGRKGFAQVAKASLFGVPLPLCSCGVLPVAASLRRHGAGKGATTAFLLSTPQTGVDSIAVTWALLGPVVAVIRPLAAFITGIAGGMVVQAVEPDEGPQILPEQDGECADSCCSSEGEEHPLLKALRYGFVTLPRDIGRALFVGLLLSGVIAAFLGPDHVKAVFGGGILPYVVAMAVGIPLYVCATASTPIAASLIGAGLSPGAALVFLISGPATNVASVTTLLRVLGRRVVAVYLATVVVGSLATGLVVDFLLGGWVLTGMPAAAIETAHRHGDGTMAMGWGFKEICAIVLLAVLAGAMWPRRSQASEENPTAENHEERLELSVGGMRCDGCVTSIGRALREVEGVRNVTVDLSTAKAGVTGTGLDAEVLCAEVRALGFDCE